MGTTVVNELARPLADLSYSTLFFFIVLIFSIKYLMDLFHRNPRRVKFSKTLPGPPALPLLGNGPEFLNRANSEGLPNLLLKYEEEYGSMYRLWFGKHLVIVTTDIDLIKTLFLSSRALDKPDIFTDPAVPFDGNLNLIFTLAGPLWKKTRKAMEPHFHKNLCAARMPQINELVRKNVKKVEERLDEREFNIGHLMELVSFELVQRVVLNANFDYPEEEFRKLTDTYKQSNVPLFEKTLKPWLNNPVLHFIYYGKLAHNFRKNVNKFLKKIKDEEILSTDPTSAENQISFMQLLRQIKKDFQLDEFYIYSEISALVAAGILTTTTITAYCFLMLAMNPDIQDKLYKEIIETLGSEDEDLDAKDLNNLPYLDQVLKETERIYQISPYFMRQTSEDMRYGAHAIPAGTIFMIASAAVLNSKKYYKNPEKFDPDHFSAEAVSGRPRMAFFPFGAGPRNCIGKALVEMEMKVIVIKFLQRFKFSTTEKMKDIKVLIDFSTLMDDELMLSIQPRRTR